ncbi:SPOSA6832_02311, partial [Sporobolomyces salmonicolor]
MPPPKASDGFFSSIRSFGSSSSAQQPPQQQNDPSSSSYIPNPSTLLVDLAPSLLSSSSRLLHPSNLTAHQASLSSASATSTASSTSQSLRRKLSFLRSGLHAGNPGRPGWAEVGTQLYIRERVDELLRLPIPAAPFPLSGSPAPASRPGQKTIEPPPRPEDPVPLYAGFKATIPTSQASKLERRKRRALLSEQALGLEGGKLGLKERGDKARGLLGAADKIDEFGQVFGGEDSLRIGRKPRLSRRKRNASLASSLSSSSNLASDPPASRLELEADATAVEGDMANVASKASKRASPASPSAPSASASVNPAAASSSLLASSSSSRRRKGPAFLPSEHDELPPGVAFMTLHGHLSPLLSLDFSEPYGTLVTSSSDASVRLWDLTTGEETGFLKGHDGHVKVLQVEGGVAVTGGKDGGIRVWDLERAEEDFFTGRVARRDERDEDVFSAAVGGGGGGGSGLINGNRTAVEDDGLLREPGEKSVRDGDAEKKDEKEDGPCVRVLDGHTKAVTSLYFDGPCLRPLPRHKVTGSSDSTLRQWDLTTGQCVQTMDILWAISNPLPSSSTLYPASSHSPSQTDPFSASFSHSPPSTPRKNFGALRRQSSLFDSSPGAVGASPSTTSYADGSWEPYEDFVGGVQFWGYALASGTADGCDGLPSYRVSCGAGRPRANDGLDVVEKGCAPDRPIARSWGIPDPLLRRDAPRQRKFGQVDPGTRLPSLPFPSPSPSLSPSLAASKGTLDRNHQIWDLRTGSISDTIRYDHPVTALQFDSRKIVAAAGENGVKVFNRTTLQHSTLSINGHTSPVERLRFMDRYLATGGRDCAVKIWALL